MYKKAPGVRPGPVFQHLKLQYDGPLSNFAFKFNLRRYNKDFSSVLAFFGEAVKEVKPGKEVKGGGGGRVKEAPMPEIQPIRTNRFGDVNQNEYMRDVMVGRCKLTR